MNKKTGRPKKVPTEVKMQIVDLYLVSEGVEDERVMQQHGIYSKLADFAKEKGYVLEPHDFSRDADIKRYLQSLISGGIKETHESFPAYEPLDVAYVVSKPRNELGILLNAREEYFQGLYRRAVAVIERFDGLAARNRLLEKEVEQTREQLDEINAQYLQAKTALRDKTKENEYLRRFIKKELTPERADRFFKSLISQEDALDIAEKSASTPIKELTHEDRKLHREAENAVSINSVIQLFTERSNPNE